MLCENCGKNLSTTYLKLSINGAQKEMYLCSECAAQYTGAQNSFSGLGNMFYAAFMPNKTQQKQCEGCNATLKYIEATGKVGCAKCYEAFGESIEPAIIRAHGTARHLQKQKPLNKAEEKRKELLKAIENEEYEKAARLRDEIKALEGNK